MTKPKRWLPWQLSPDSDPQERWILVNADDDGEEHPDNVLYDSQEDAERARDSFQRA